MPYAALRPSVDWIEVIFFGKGVDCVLSCLSLITPALFKFDWRLANILECDAISSRQVVRCALNPSNFHVLPNSMQSTASQGRAVPPSWQQIGRIGIALRAPESKRGCVAHIGHAQSIAKEFQSCSFTVSGLRSRRVDCIPPSQPAPPPS